MEQNFIWALRNQNVRRINQLKRELDEHLVRKDIMWMERSREMWIRYRDGNTKFFHLWTIIRKERNFISTIKINDQEWNWK